MSLKLNRLSLIAALSITAATAFAAHAAPNQADIAVLESSNPDSLDYASRDVGGGPATEDEIDWLESGNPHSVNYANRPVSTHRVTNEELQSLEIGNPDAIR